MIKKYTTIETNSDQAPSEIKQSTISSMKRFFREIDPRKLSLLILVVVAIGGVCFSVYFYNKYRVLTVDQKTGALKETQRLVGVLGKLMELPQGEVPTIATISDVNKLKGQTFFDQSQNGDVLFAYTTSMKAILYRPSTNKIINVAPISLNNQGQNQTQSSTQNVTPHMHTIAYYNGTGTVGLAALAEKTIQSKYSDYKTVKLTNASRRDYQGILVIDISGTHRTEVSDLATLLNGKVGNLPQGENVPDADILIIVGK